MARPVLSYRVPSTSFRFGACCKGWPLLHLKTFPTVSAQPSPDNRRMPMALIWFPVDTAAITSDMNHPSQFHTMVSNMDNIEKILELCPTADDIYLNALIRICGFGVTFHMNNPLLSIISPNNVTLVSHNGDIGDPESINAKQLKDLVSYYRSLSISNPFMV